MTENIILYVDYIGSSKYGIFIDDPLKDRPDHICISISASLGYISKKYGIDASVEISHCAEIIFKVENGLDMDENIS
jgi:hypothetical protein